MTRYSAIQRLAGVVATLVLAALLVLPFILNAASTSPEPVAPADSGHVASHGGHGDDGDISAVLLHHVMDGDEWEIVPGLFSIHLPTGVTVHLLMVWFVVVLIAGLFLLGVRQKGMKVTGLANVLEMLVLFIRDDIVYPVMSNDQGEKWLPFFITLFVFILGANYLGMIPVFRTATGNFNVTSALAAMILVVIFAAGITQLGIVHFVKNMYPEGSPAPIGILVCLLEFVGMFVKAIVLSLRLFANMLAGHLVILALLSMIFILSPWFCSISVPLAVFVCGLELLVALIQSVVFTLLSCIFISMASSAH